MKYDAFISYSHRQDEQLGNSIEKNLEKYAKPLFRRRALEIFRDANDLSLSPDLGDKIREGLLNSNYFICLASKPYAQSKWCEREVDYWLEHKSINNFIIVLTDGDIVFDDSTQDFDWEKTTALPKNLSGVFKGEPFYLDFRNLGDKDQLSLENPDYRQRLVLLAATIHGKSVGDMESEAAKQHRRMLRIRNVTIAVLSVLLLVAIGASIIAVNKKNEALLSTYLANSQGQLKEDPTTSIRLAETAYNFAKDKGFSTTDATEQLIKVFYSGFGFYMDRGSDFTEPSEEESDKYSSNPTELEIDILGLTDSIIASIPRDEYLINQSDIFIDNNKQSAYLIVSSNALNFSRIYFIDKEFDGYHISSTDIILPEFTSYTSYIQDIDISKDGRYTLLGSANGKTALIENESYRYKPYKNQFKDRAICTSSADYPIAYVSFVEDGTYFGTVSFRSEYVNGIRQDAESHNYYYKTEAFPYIEIVNTDTEEGNLSIDGLYYMIPDDAEANTEFWFHYAQTVNSIYGAKIAEFPDAMGVNQTLISSPDGVYLAGYQGVFNAAGDLLISLNLDIIDNAGVALCFSKDSKFLKVSYIDGMERIFALDPEFILARLNNIEAMGPVANLSNDDRNRFLID